MDHPRAPVPTCLSDVDGDKKLQSICRRVIRQHLLSVGNHSDLFNRIPKLGLPAPVNFTMEIQQESRRAFGTADVSIWADLSIYVCECINVQIYVHVYTCVCMGVCVHVLICHGVTSVKTQGWRDSPHELWSQRSKVAGNQVWQVHEPEWCS